MKTGSRHVKGVRRVMIELDGSKMESVGPEQLFDGIGQEVSRERISRVEPRFWALRWLFLLLRRLVPETGKIAQWTREWPVRWRVRMLANGYTFGNFAKRSDAINAEIEYWIFRGYAESNRKRH